MILLIVLIALSAGHSSAWMAMEMGAELPSKMGRHFSEKTFKTNITLKLMENLNHLFCPAAAPNKCYVKTYRKILSAGKVWQPKGECVSVECEGVTTLENGKRAFTIQYKG